MNHSTNELSFLVWKFTRGVMRFDLPIWLQDRAGRMEVSILTRECLRTTDYSRRLILAESVVESLSSGYKARLNALLWTYWCSKACSRESRSWDESWC